MWTPDVRKGKENTQLCSIKRYQITYRVILVHWKTPWHLITSRFRRIWQCKSFYVSSSHVGLVRVMEKEFLFNFIFALFTNETDTRWWHMIISCPRNCWHWHFSCFHGIRTTACHLNTERYFWFFFPFLFLLQPTFMITWIKERNYVSR